MWRLQAGCGRTKRRKRRRHVQVVVVRCSYDCVFHIQWWTTIVPHVALTDHGERLLQLPGKSNNTDSTLAIVLDGTGLRQTCRARTRAHLPSRWVLQEVDLCHWKSKVSTKRLKYRDTHQICSGTACVKQDSSNRTADAFHNFTKPKGPDFWETPKKQFWDQSWVEIGFRKT